jgi:serine/threonine protein kinase
VIKYSGYFPGVLNHKPAIITKFVENGTLANHLPDSDNSKLCQLEGPTRIAKIIVEIVVAMQYIHSQGIIHCNLTPNNILLDWHWNIRIKNFRQSFVTNNQSISMLSNPSQSLRAGDFRYLAPELHDNIINFENDVFSFGMILYELVVGKPVLEESMSGQKAFKCLVSKQWKLNFPDFVLPEAKQLICDCLNTDFQYRPLFEDIFDRLEEMRFKLMRGVNSSKLIKFVKKIKPSKKTD